MEGSSGSTVSSLDSLRYALQALDFPGAEDFTPADTSKTRKLVRWLEDRYIRCYKVADRDCFSSQKTTEEWHKAVYKYLQKLECPKALLEAKEEWIDMRDSLSSNTTEKQNLTEVEPTAWRLSTAPLFWLVSQAVALAYEERAAEYNDYEKVAAEVAEMQKEREELEKARPTLEEMCAVLGMDGSGKSTLQLLEAVTRQIEMGQGFLGGAESSQTHFSPELEGKYEFNPEMERTITALKMLYVQDLKDLQDSINEIVAKAQECTAAAKIDASLGVTRRG